MKRLLDLLRRLFWRPVPDTVEAQMDELRRALEKQIESDERWTGGSSSMPSAGDGHG